LVKDGEEGRESEDEESSFTFLLENLGFIN
jgi:hypothetical protein